MVREIHGEAQAKKYHINDIILYFSRDNSAIAAAMLKVPTTGTTPVAISLSRTNASGGDQVLHLVTSAQP